MNTSQVIETLLVSTNRLIRHAARETGSSVTSAAWSTLSVLATEGPMRNGDLARAARISQPGMTKVLAGLVEDEWVIRIADVEDSRAWLIAISPRGESAIADWRAQLAAALEPVFAELPSDDWDTLTRAAAILASRVPAAAVAA